MSPRGLEATSVTWGYLSSGLAEGSVYRLASGRSKAERHTPPIPRVSAGCARPLSRVLLALSDARHSGGNDHVPDVGPSQGFRRTSTPATGASPFARALPSRSASSSSDCSSGRTLARPWTLALPRADSTNRVSASLNRDAASGFPSPWFLVGSFAISKLLCLLFGAPRVSLAARTIVCSARCPAGALPSLDLLNGSSNLSAFSRRSAS